MSSSDRIDQIEALRALREEGTVARAALRLRLTPSAVSKRIGALEGHLGRALLLKVGRRAVLSDDAVRILDEAEPLLVRLADVLAGNLPSPTPTVTVAATESALCGGLAPMLRAAAEGTGVRLELHAHRGPRVLDRVRAGEVDAGVCAGGELDGDLVGRTLGDEPMGIVPTRSGACGDTFDVWTIEATSLTWEAIARRVSRATVDGRPLRITGRLESFPALVQVALAGIAPALVPQGVALAAGAPWRPLAGIGRPMIVVARRSALRRPATAGFVDALGQVSDLGPWRA